MTCASVPRAVASVASRAGLLMEPRSLPLAVLTRNRREYEQGDFTAREELYIC